MKRWLYFLVITLCLVACNHKQGAQTNEASEIQTEKDLEGKVVGTLTGCCFEIDLAGRKEYRIVRQPTLSDCIASLRKGRIDAIVFDEVCFNEDILKGNGIRKAFRTQRSYPCAFACSKPNIDLANKFNEFLAKLKSSGELNKITEKWMQSTDCSNVGTPRTNDSLLNGEPIIVGTTYTTAPISYLIGDEWNGFEIEILNRFGEYIGRPVQYRLFDFAALIPALQAGKIDMAGGVLFVTEERQKALVFTDVYYNCHGAFFVRDKNAANATDDPKLSGIKGSFQRNLLAENRWVFLAKGLKVTLEITLLSILFGSMLGIGLLAMRRSSRRWLNKTAKAYSLFLRGIPMVVLLMILFYIVLIGLSGVGVAVVAFSLTFASSFAATMDSAIQTVGNQQREAGKAMGFSSVQIFRYITGPQAFKHALPRFKSEAVSLIKNTSVVGYVAIQDLTRACDMIRARTFEAAFPLLFITIIYFVLAWLMSKLLDFIFKTAIKLSL